MLRQYRQCISKMSNTICLLVLAKLLAAIVGVKYVDCWSIQDGGGIAAALQSDQIELNFSVLEGVPNGTLIGVIRSPNSSVNIQPPYLIVPVPGGSHKSNTSTSSNHMLSSASGNTGRRGGTAGGGSSGSVDTDLSIDQTTGEIRTAVPLDREERSYYSFIALPISGAVIKVTITIEDINDNSPKFPTKVIDLEFPENSKPNNVKRTLPPARDLDLGKFGTQKYRIVSGNIGNAFRLLSHREKDDVLYLDLQVNGPLDRETISNYTLVIEALDGGQPQLRDEMTVRIAILDHNDCEPVFSESHYYGTVAENVTIGSPLLRVVATDSDQGDNGLVTYSLHSKPLSGLSPYFEIDKHNGWIFVVKALDFETKEIHELVVIARDSGAQPLETSALVSIRITDVNDNQPTFSLLFLTENARPEIPENAKIGDLVARVSVNDADSSDFSVNSQTNDQMNRLSVSLTGNDHSFGLTTQDNVIYMIVVTGPLDRQLKAKYNLTVIVTDQGSPPLNKTSSFELEIMEISDTPSHPHIDPHNSRETIHHTIQSGGGNDNDHNNYPSTLTTDHRMASNPTSYSRSPHLTHTYNTTLMSSETTPPLDLPVLGASNSTQLIGLSSNNTTVQSGTSYLGVSTSSPSLPGWILFLIVLLMLTTIVLMASIVVICLNQHQQQQQIMSDHIRNIGPHNVGSFLQKIGPIGSPNHSDLTYHSHHTSSYGTTPQAPPPCYNDLTLQSSAVLAATAEGHSASSGRGSAEDDVEADIEDVDEEIRMINESGNYYTDEEDRDVTTTAEYLARLGVINHHEEEREESSIAVEDEEEGVILDQMNNIIDSSLSINNINTKGQSSSSRHHMSSGSQSCGSMSSILHSEEELSGSYNWDYLQNWGPKYLPLSSVFAEIARLKANSNNADQHQQQHQQQLQFQLQLQQHLQQQQHQQQDMMQTIEPQMIRVVENASIRSSSSTTSSSHNRHQLQQQQQQQQQQTAVVNSNHHQMIPSSLVHQLHINGSSGGGGFQPMQSSSVNCSPNIDNNSSSGDTNPDTNNAMSMDQEITI